MLQLPRARSYQSRLPEATGLPTGIPRASAKVVKLLRAGQVDHCSARGKELGHNGRPHEVTVQWKLFTAAKCCQQASGAPHLPSANALEGQDHAEPHRMAIGQQGRPPEPTGQRELFTAAKHYQRASGVPSANALEGQDHAEPRRTESWHSGRPPEPVTQLELSIAAIHCQLASGVQTQPSANALEDQDHTEPDRSRIWHSGRPPEPVTQLEPSRAVGYDPRASAESQRPVLGSLSRTLDQGRCNTVRRQPPDPLKGLFDRWSSLLQDDQIHCQRPANHVQFPESVSASIRDVHGPAGCVRFCLSRKLQAGGVVHHRPAPGLTSAAIPELERRVGLALHCRFVVFWRAGFCAATLGVCML